MRPTRGTPDGRGRVRADDPTVASAFRPSPPPSRPWLWFAALWLVAAAPLLARLGAAPPFPYNWEAYTGWHLLDDWVDQPPDLARVLALTDGLMTDSGQGPLVGVPAWLGVHVGGVGLWSLRAPVAIVAALAVPLLWLAGRRLLPERTALLAALLLAAAAPFLFSGRTATLVGISLVPELLALLALVGTLAATDAKTGWRWLAVLQLALLAGEYAYAPVRLLWPVSAAALAAALFADRGRGRDRVRWRAAALLLTATALPVGLVAIGWATGSADPATAATGYFNARGEQLLASGFVDDEVLSALAPESDGSAVAVSGPELVARLVGRNGSVLASLLADRDTRPSVTDHWNEQGRLWPAPVGAAFALGLLVALWRALRRRPEFGLLLLATTALTLPLLLTTKVHVGRLLPALPGLLLLAAVGAEAAGAGLARAAGALLGGRAAGPLRAVARLAPPAALLAVVVLGSRAEFAVPSPANRQTATTSAIAKARAALPATGLLAVVDDPALGAEIEQVHIADARLLLDRAYSFVDLGQSGGTLPPPDPQRPTLLYGDILDRLRDGTLPHPCDPRYLVAPEVADAFRQALSAARCAKPPMVGVLPK